MCECRCAENAETLKRIEQAVRDKLDMKLDLVIDEPGNRATLRKVSAAADRAAGRMKG